MPITMIAVGRYYDPENRVEYPDGGHFQVETVEQAMRLERRRKAKRLGGEAQAAAAEADPVEEEHDESNEGEGEDEDDLRSLRQEYRQLSGKNASRNWSREELHQRIGTYRRRDVRAKD